MTNTNREEHTTGEELLRSLESLRLKYPEHARLLTSFIEDLEIIVAPRPADPRECVLAALRHGQTTIPDIRDWTRLNEPLVRKIVADLVRLNLVHEGKLDDNKTRVYIFLAV